MQHAIEKLGKSQIKLTVELTQEDFDKYREKTAEQLSNEVKIPGFREGKAPADVVEKHVGPDRFAAYMLENALSGSYSKVITDEKLHVVTHPKVNILTEKPLKYEATVALLPEVTVKDYKKITVPEEKVEVTEKEMQEAFEDFKKYYATLAPVTRSVKKGDRVEIDFDGTDLAGKELEGTKSRNHPIVVGEGMLLPEFEENLIGMQKDETKNFNVTFPKDYHHKPFQGKVVNFNVTMKKIEEVQLPEISEDFIEKVTGTRMTTDALQERMKKNIHAEKENAARMRREDKFLEMVLKQVEIELPEMLIEEEEAYIKDELKADLERKGIDMAKYLEKIKKDEKEVAKEMRVEAEKRLRLRFALQYLFKEEKVEVSDEELEKEIEAVIGNFPDSEKEKVRSEYRNRQARVQLRNRLMLYKLFEALLHKKG